jgi:hypothetical protein
MRRARPDALDDEPGTRDVRRRSRRALPAAVRDAEARGDAVVALVDPRSRRSRLDAVTDAVIAAARRDAPRPAALVSREEPDPSERDDRALQGGRRRGDVAESDPRPRSSISASA